MTEVGTYRFNGSTCRSTWRKVYLVYTRQGTTCHMHECDSFVNTVPVCTSYVEKCGVADVNIQTCHRDPDGLSTVFGIFVCALFVGVVRL